MPPDRRYVEGVLGDVENAVRFLRELAAVERAEFAADMRACYASAYALIMAIEGVAAVASHLIATRGLDSPAGAPEAMRILSRAGIIRSPELAERLVEMARFRNLLVHRYWVVDYGRVFDILQSHLGDFGAFAQDVTAALDDPDPGGLSG